MLELIRNLVSRDDEGASAVEYGMLVAGIAALIVVIVFALGGVVKGAFSTTCATVSSNGASSAATGSCAG